MTALKVYNTMQRKKQEFIPVDNNKVTMYVCGPTVYNYISIGNTRPVIVFNMIKNYLEYCGYSVDYVQNITDVEDKIIDKAKQEGINCNEVTERYIAAFKEDLENLKISGFKDMPLATESIPGIISIIEKIIENGFGYEADGDVYFDVKKFSEYGKLSGQKIEEMKSQETEETKKKNSIDFALWKKAKPDEPSWESPWGEGRPGWHIECSAMSTDILNRTIDIHGGGLDLIFPHHENEIAQTKAAYPDEQFVKYWLHNGMIEVKDEKMSKSKGLKENWILRNLLKKYNHNILKMYMLSTHYRSPLEFSQEKLNEAKRGVERIANTLRNMIFIFQGEKKLEDNQVNDELKQLPIQTEEDFKQAMDDDFNSAKAIGVIFEMVRKINMIIQPTSFKASPGIAESLKHAYDKLLGLTAVLGFDLADELKSASADTEITEEQINGYIGDRERARKEKNFKEADRIRSLLMEKGIVLEDRKEGTIWKYSGEGSDL